MALKTPEINPSFGLNGSHKARNSNAAKGARLCPPPDISKANRDMKLRPITTAHDRQNEHKRLVIKDLRNSAFYKIYSVWTYFTKYNRPDSLERFPLLPQHRGRDLELEDLIGAFVNAADA